MDEKKTIKEILLFKDLTQTELAEKNAMSKQSISQYLNSNSKMNIKVFTQLLNSINCTVKVVDDDSGREWIVSFDE